METILFCHYVAARVWGTDQIVILVRDLYSATYLTRAPQIQPISEYRRFFVSPEIGSMGGVCNIYFST